MREIARRLGRAPSTISRELRRNAATRGGGLEYRATTAQWHADRSARRPKPAKLAVNAALREYVQDRLAGTVVAPDGAAVHGPAVPWKGRRHGPRQDRRWAKAWSPEQIARRLRLDFPDDETMRISHEAIYQALFVQGRGALRRELTACLRTGRALRVPRARTRRRGKSFVTPEIMISQRPAEAADRAVPGHWEGDLILGLGSSAIGTLVERTTRFTMLLHLPRMPGHGEGPRVKNGPALAGHGAEAVRDAITRTITTLPEQLRRSLTWDQGAEMAQHAACGSRPGCRSTSAILTAPGSAAPTRTPTGCCASTSRRNRPQHAHAPTTSPPSRLALNARPRKTLGWKTPAEALDEFCYSRSQRPCCDDRLNPPCTPRSEWKMHPAGGRRERDCPLERGEGVTGLEVAGERVADDAPRPGVEDHREIDEAGRDRDVGDVARPRAGWGRRRRCPWPGSGRSGRRGRCRSCGETAAVSVG